MQKQIWLLSILSVIIVILVCILIFVPAKPKPVSLQTGIVIASPKANEEISSPIKITGHVNGDGWAGFEGQVGGVALVVNGATLAQAPLTATSDWTILPISFEATLNFTTNSAGAATLVFHNENPSGDPAKDKTFVLPVNLK